MDKRLKQYKKQAEEELEHILSYWMRYTLDEERGGFIGRMAYGNQLDPEAPKGSVLNSRILWAFSAAFNHTGKQAYLSVATRAFRYILDSFIDREYGGVFWTVDAEGRPLDTKKQIYAVSFAIYGLSEYYKAVKDPVALDEAIRLYKAIVVYSYDSVNGGYLEALSRDWKELADRRLSTKDANEKKSMNTHLHVLEGFASLYAVWPDPELKNKLRELVGIFLLHIIAPDTGHLLLFFDEQWNPKSATVSYGHDIEAAWLLQEAAALLDEPELLKQVQQAAIQVAEAAEEGLDKDGGLWYEYEPAEKHLVRQKHWWPQAEAMVGFLHAWQLTGKERYLSHSIRAWEYIHDKIIDKQGGEWYWGIQEDCSVMRQEDKVGIWKCPYHNTRACMEISKRLQTIEQIV
ncbi:MAG TPA: AGE family epimerase/isomerase [Flavisolibacter sp.]|jgi:mannobiose 2-epimerase|nr:AGE family epimerase/isomerase [Flavisolibacter sp.]